jgi:hypothetical protein
MLAAAVLAAPALAAAQTDFCGLKAKPGDFVYVVSPSGVEVGGPIRSLSATRLAIDGHEFAPEPGMKIQRRGDPRWDAAVFGFALGALAGGTVGAEACLHEPLWHCAVGGGLWLGGIAALVDWRHTGRTTVYEGRTVSARVGLLAPTRKGIALSIAF